MWAITRPCTAHARGEDQTPVPRCTDGTLDTPGALETPGALDTPGALEMPGAHARDGA